MHLYQVPLFFVLCGLVLYTVLGGADFGAGWWQLAAGRGKDAERIRDQAHHAMAPVWEANHVWLIFVLTVFWTAYPAAFGSIMSTLAIPLFIAGVGIILRGATYALRSGAEAAAEVRRIDTAFAFSSILTPFALGAAAGGIASRRVPLGNAAGDQVDSWLNWTSISVGILTVVAAAYMAAVFLSADAVRAGDTELERAFRVRALATGAVAGAVAIATLFIVRSDAHPLFHHLVAGDALPAIIVSIAAGVATMALVWRKRYEPARYSAAVAVAAIIAGWALAQSPVLLPGLTVREAAAPRETLIAVTVAVTAGAVVLFPSLAWLFKLVLSGTFDEEEKPQDPPRARDLMHTTARGLSGRAAVGLLVVGFGLTTIADSRWAHAIGVTALLGFVALAFPWARPPEVSLHETAPRRLD
ncbi:MAG: cytochrome d ubiquinol oxidase subunit II [Gaiellaceae bacterium]